VAVATLDGRAYYKIAALLKKIGVTFENLSPGQRVESHIKLVFTTRSERVKILFENVAYIEDLSDDPDIAKERIFSHLFGGRDDMLVVGIDPGERIGLAAFYQQREIESCVLSSVDKVVERVTRFLENSSAKRKIVRIGDGKPDLAQYIASNLSKKNRNIEIELVDERGTSALIRGASNRRGLRDQRSAMIIAFRRGRRFIEV